MRWRGWILGGVLVAIPLGYVGGFFLFTEFHTGPPGVSTPINVRFFPSEGWMQFWEPMKLWDYNVHGRMPWIAKSIPSR